ncbi:MAG: DNA polymerase domain-containing protein, partial [Thermofilaceae archaeon]
TQDVAVLVEIEKRYGFVSLQLKIAELVNLPVGMLTPVRMGDTLILRRARELGYVLSNAVQSEKKSYPGAYVFEPRRKGLVRNVAVFDFESLYPNIIINERIDIPGFNGEVLPHIISQLLEMRRKAKEQYKATGDARYDVEQKAYKIIANALYGLFGTEGFRFLDLQRASAVTAKGREMLLKASSIAEELGYSVIYGDTDSIFITGWTDPGELALVETALNEMLKPYRVKLEYYGDIYLIAKKKYILRLPDGKRIVKGVELVRGDWARIFKEVVSSLVEMVFSGCTAQDIKSYLAGIRKELYSGRLDDKLVMCKGYSHSKEYKVASEHVKAARILARRHKVPLESITEVCYVYVKHGDGVEPVYNGRIPKGIDYDRYWERIMELAKRMLILNNAGLAK